MRQGQKFTAELQTQIRSVIKTALSARHVPAYIFEIEDIPVSVLGIPFKHLSLNRIAILDEPNSTRLMGKKLK